MKHLQVSGHQPSQVLSEKKNKSNEFKQCYTCKMQFNGYFNLMEHRSLVHPSNKKCRNFPASCTFGTKCWYVHHEPMETDQTAEAAETRVWNFKCNVCEEEFKDRSDFMKHKKKNHPENNLTCQNFVRDKCQRSEDSCWFQHRSDSRKPETSSQEQVFQEVSANLFPPNQLSSVLQMIDSLCQKEEKMEKTIQDMKN